MNGDINLLPSQAKFQAKRMALKAKINSFLWIFGGIWVLLLVLVVGGFYISQLIAGQLDKKYQSTFDQYKNLLNNMVVNQQVKYQAKVVGQVLAQRFEYGNSIEMITSLFSNKVKVEDVQIEGKKQFVLKGTIVDGNYVDEVEQKLISINNGEVEGFLGAALTDIQFESGLWYFEMEVNLE